MNKLLKGLLFAFAGLFTIAGLASCGGEESHTHVAAEKWSRDSSQHWHACTVEGCEEMLDAAAHEYGDWVVDSEPDHDKSVNGQRHKVCKVCGFTMKEAIPAKPVIYIRGSVNGWGNDWKTDDDRAPWKLKIVGDDETITGVQLPAGAEFKIADLVWGTQFNVSKLDAAAKEYFEGEENIKVKVAGTYTITIKNVLGDAKITVVKTA